MWSPAIFRAFRAMNPPYCTNNPIKYHVGHWETPFPLSTILETSVPFIRVQKVAHKGGSLQRGTEGAVMVG